MKNTRVCIQNAMLFTACTAHRVLRVRVSPKWPRTLGFRLTNSYYTRRKRRFPTAGLTGLIFVLSPLRIAVYNPKISDFLLVLLVWCSIIFTLKIHLKLNVLQYVPLSPVTWVVYQSSANYVTNCL
jgi:hypothetical protein